MGSGSFNLCSNATLNRSQPPMVPAQIFPSRSCSTDSTSPDNPSPTVNNSSVACEFGPGDHRTRASAPGAECHQAPLESTIDCDGSYSRSPVPPAGDHAELTGVAKCRATAWDRAICKNCPDVLSRAKAVVGVSTSSRDAETASESARSSL